MLTEEEIAAQKAAADAKTADDEAKAKEEADAKAKAESEADEKLGEGGKKALDAERKLRDEADKRAAAAEKKLADIAAAKAKADEDDAVKKGEFQQLAEDRKAKLDEVNTSLKSLTDERDALAATVQTYEDRDRAAIEAWVKDHKGQHPDLFEFDPGPDAPLEQRMTWFEKARKHAESRVTNPVNGNGAKPKPLNGQDPKEEAAAKAASRRMYSG